MGRIQRKKAPGDKKRKKQRAAGEVKAKQSKDGALTSRQGAGLAEPVKAIKKSATGSAGGQAVVVKQPSDNFFTKAIQFLREVKVELKKVAWPSRKQTIGSTAVVIALVVLISLFLGVVDMGLSTLIRFVLQ